MNLRPGKDNTKEPSPWRRIAMLVLAGGVSAAAVVAYPIAAVPVATGAGVVVAVVAVTNRKP